MKRMLVLAVAILAVSTGAASAATTPVAVGDGWHAFITPAGTGVGGVPFTSPYTFTASAPVLVTVTDIFCIGDRYTISDGLTTLGTTSMPGPLDCRVPDTGDPAVALADPDYSHGRFALAPGAHSIGIVLTTAPFGNASGYIRFDLMTAADCGNGGWQAITAAPAFTSESDCTAFIQTDTTAPVIAPHADVVADASGPSGAIVTYALPTAADPDDAVSTLGCTPVSGGVFPIGTTSVTCVAFDTHGNSSSSTFTVHVAGASEQLTSLLRSVTGRGPGKSLAAKITSALADLDVLDSSDACSALTAFGNEVSAQSGKALPPDQAASLREAAARIQEVMGCTISQT